MGNLNGVKELSNIFYGEECYKAQGLKNLLHKKTLISRYNLVNEWTAVPMVEYNFCNLISVAFTFGVFRPFKLTLIFLALSCNNDHEFLC